MITAWRLVKAKHAREAFDGEGASKYGGRWNPRGRAVVYLTDSLALAALELFVHLDDEDLDERFVAFRVSIPAGLRMATIRRSQLPRDWRSVTRPTVTRSKGSAWLERDETAVMRVPSIIVPQETNVLVNPAHRDFRRLKIGRGESFLFDSRMWK